MRTLKEAARIFMEEREDFPYYFGDFLDDFYRDTTTNTERTAMLTDEVGLFDSSNREILVKMAYLAASANYLSNLYELEPPAWCFKEIFFLKEPYFSLNAKGDLRTFLLLESPTEFRARQLFVSNSSLTRA